MSRLTEPIRPVETQFMTAMQGSFSLTFLQTQATYIDAANLDQRHLIDRLSCVPRPICQGTIENI